MWSRSSFWRGAWVSLVAVSGSAWLSACAAPTEAEGVGTQVRAVRSERWLLTLTSGGPVNQDLSARLSELAAVPVRVLTRLTARTMVIGLDCDSEEVCEAAARRIRVDKDWVAELRRDDKRGLVQPPSRGEAR